MYVHDKFVGIILRGKGVEFFFFAELLSLFPHSNELWRNSVCVCM